MDCAEANIQAVMENLLAMESILNKDIPNAELPRTWLLTLVRSSKTNLRAAGGIPFQ